MDTHPKKAGRMAKFFGFLGIGLCGLCCALPILGIVGGAGLLSAVAVHAEKIALALLIISLCSFAIAFYRRKKALTCDINCECKTEISSKGNLNTTN